MAVMSTAQSVWLFCYESWPWTHPQTSTMATSGMWCWLFHSTPVLPPSIVLTHFDAFSKQQQQQNKQAKKKKKIAAHYGAGSCERVSETVTLSLGMLNHNLENTIRHTGKSDPAVVSLMQPGFLFSYLLVLHAPVEFIIFSSNRDVYQLMLFSHRVRMIIERERKRERERRGRDLHQLILM